MIARETVPLCRHQSTKSTKVALHGSYMTKILHVSSSPHTCWLGNIACQASKSMLARPLIHVGLEI